MKYDKRIGMLTEEILEDFQFAPRYQQYLVLDESPRSPMMMNVSR